MSVAFKVIKLHGPAGAFDDGMVTSLLKKLCPPAAKAPELTVTISKRVAEVKEELAQLGTDAAPELSYATLHMLERSLPGGIPRYAVIRKDGKPVLVAYFQVFTITSANFRLTETNRLVKTLMNFFVDLKNGKVVVLGNVLRNETAGYCYDSKALTSDEAIEAVTGLAEKVAAQECATAIILKELRRLSDKTEKLLTDNKYSTPFEDNVMDLAIDPAWKSITDYTKALSRKYKARANKILEARQPLNVRPLSVAEIVQLQDDIDGLFSATVGQQSFSLTRPKAGYFTALSQLHKDHFEVVGFMHDGKLVAFYSAFKGDSNYDIHYVGLNYELNIKYQLYFNILFSGLDRAIALGKHILHLGRTSLDAKASLGAKPRKLPYFIKFEYMPGFITERFIKYFASMEHNRWKQRDPFK